MLLKTKKLICIKILMLLVGGHVAFAVAARVVVVSVFWRRRLDGFFYLASFFFSWDGSIKSAVSFRTATTLVF